MPCWNNRQDLVAGDVAIPAAQWMVGVLYDHETRANAEGRGAAVELPVVFRLLDLVEAGEISPREARLSLAPVLADLVHLDRKNAELECLMDG
ncbi:hypothetical protein [Streptomyces sp. NPDC058254]|uniref:hypothetical protein n=1 Tax=Streptomyces sp. NPDC058254 TaxID=3346406 RepID=UPI0036EC9463